MMVMANYTLALTKQGEVYGIGENTANQTLQINAGITETFQKLDIINKTIVQISANTKAAHALTEDGEIYSWGTSEFGELGIGVTSTAFYPPTKITGALFGNPLTIKAKFKLNIVITDSTLVNVVFFGKLNNDIRNAPTNLSPVTKKVISASIGDNVIMMVIDDGTLYCKGDKNACGGQNPTDISFVSNVEVNIGSEIAKQVACVNKGCLVLTDSSNVLSIGVPMVNEFTIGHHTPYVTSQNVTGIKAVYGFTAAVMKTNTSLFLANGPKEIIIGNNEQGNSNTFDYIEDDGLIDNHVIEAIYMGMHHTFIKGRTCFGIPANRTVVCSGHGICNGQDACTCQQGYTGSQCANYTCHGTSSLNDLVCSGNGKCIDINTCLCDDGYSQEDCSHQNVTSCGLSYSNGDYVCSQHGECIDFNECSCESTYTGVICQIPSCYGIFANSSQACSGNGNCTSLNTCECKEHFRGITCDVCIIGYAGVHCNETVEPIILEPHIVGSSVIGSCNGSRLLLDATTSTTNNTQVAVTYHWKLVEGPQDDFLRQLISDSDFPFLLLPANISTGTYRVSLKLEASEGQQSEAIFHTFTKHEISIPLATLHGANTQYAFVNEPYVIYGGAVNPCSDIEPSFEWTILQGDPLLFQNIQTNQSTLSFPNGFPKRKANYTIQLRTFYTSIANSSTTTRLELNTIVQPLIAKINDTSRVVPISKPIYLSAASSIDPNNLTETSSFDFSCTFNGQRDCSSTELIHQSNDIVLFNPMVDGFYVLQLNFTKGLSFSRSAKLNYSVVSDARPFLYIEPPANTVFNVHSKFSLTAVLIDESLVDVSITWSIVDPASFQLTNEHTLTGSTTGNHLVIAPNAFNQSFSTAYTFRATALDLNTLKTAFAEVTMSINEPPQLGSFDISPKAGSALDSLFQMAFFGWQDSELPLRYEVYYVHPETQKEMIIISRTTQSNIGVRLPQSGCFNEQYQLTIIGRVYDSLGALATIRQNITVLPLEFSTALKYVSFANGYIPNDYHGNTPPSLKSQIPNVWDVIHLVASSVCKNCSQYQVTPNTCIDETKCIANLIHQTPDYQTFLSRAALALEYHLSTNTLDFSNSVFQQLLDSLNCLLVSTQSTSIYRYRLSQILKDIVSKNPPSNLVEPVLSMLSFMLDVEEGETCLQVDQTIPFVTNTTINQIYYTTYLTAQQMISVYTSSLLPGEQVGLIQTQKFSVRGISGVSSSFRVIKKLEQVEKNVTLSHANMIIYPEVESLFSQRSDVLTIIIMQLDFDPYCGSKHVNLTYRANRFYGMYTFMNGLSQSLSLDTPIYKMSLKSTARRSTIVEEQTCGYFYQHAYNTKTCTFTTDSSGDHCACNSNHNNILSTFVDRSLLDDPVENGTDNDLLLKLLLGIGIPLLIFILFLLFCGTCILLALLHRKNCFRSRKKYKVHPSYRVSAKGTSSKVEDILQSDMDTWSESDAGDCEIASSDETGSEVSNSSTNSIDRMIRHRRKKKRKKKHSGTAFETHVVKKNFISTSPSHAATAASPSSLHQQLDSHIFIYESDDDQEDDRLFIETSNLLDGFQDDVLNNEIMDAEKIDNFQYAFDIGFKMLDRIKVESSKLSKLQRQSHFYRVKERSKYVHSIPYFNRSVQLNPYHLKSLEYIAAILRKVKLVDFSYFYYKRAADLGSANACYNLASMLENREESSLTKMRSAYTILGYYDKALKLSPSSEMIEKRATDYRLFVLSYIKRDAQSLETKVSKAVHGQHDSAIEDRRRDLIMDMAKQMNNLLVHIASQYELAQKEDKTYIPTTNIVICYNLICHLNRSYLQPENEEIQKMYLERSVALGDAKAHYNLALWYKKHGDEKQFITLMNKSASMGNARAKQICETFIVMEDTPNPKKTKKTLPTLKSNVSSPTFSIGSMASPLISPTRSKQPLPPPPSHQHVNHLNHLSDMDD
eukprot:CAMPEP_0117420518 /NCGR_PEP_ID=MMETSP0758-20121206/1835_1 /TAXON_ID=63605 /ORGANISM="Percolomonas cosmopolitus, Strain AE-1 (ATCC 50343)" /LENGTH=1932 /DNA_ID=CAMNT_0005202173 /DNA_START=813 /DNA_END=6611 /DNA_ORIENTATION=+